MTHNHFFKCVPQIKDLPRDSHIHVTCAHCRRKRHESVRDMVEVRRMGALYLDLVEWQSRCHAPNCQGAVRFEVEAPQTEPPQLYLDLRIAA